MEKTFTQWLDDRVQATNSLLCIGLDPHVGQLAEPTANAALAFCLAIIEQTHPYAAAFKPNIAFFEAFGEEGMAALTKTLAAIPKDVPVILDCKRGDIDTTAKAYAQAAFDVHNASAVTLSPYMGLDSIKPFISGSYAKRGVFILCKTSNPSSRDIQDRQLMDGDLVYESVAKLCNQWSDSHSTCIGLVAGATDTKALQRVRFLVPNLWILCPGVGAQGGEPSVVCNAGLRADGSGLLVSVSRGISGASDMAAAAIALRNEINIHRQSFLDQVNVKHATNSVMAMHSYQQEFIEFALSKKVLQFGSFTLKSGRISPYFFNAGLFCCGASMSLLGRYYAKAIKETGVDFDVFFGPAYKGIPLATAVATAWYELYGESKDVTYNRKEAKDHGEGGSLVGASIAGRKILIIDDVITAGTAIRESVALLESCKAHLVAVAVLLDRQEKVLETSSESAIQQVQQLFAVPVISIVRLGHLISYIRGSASNRNTESETEQSLLEYLPTIEAYRSRYGVEY